MPHSVLIVDDEPEVVDYLVEELRECGYDADGVTSGSAALSLLTERSFDVIVSDVVMPEMRGIELLTSLRKLRPGQLVVMITAFGSAELAMEAVRAGASDFITKPFEIEALEHALARALSQTRSERPRERPAVTPEEPSFVAKSPAMRKVLDVARRAAAVDAAVLLTGESGVGKGLVAKFIHKQSARSQAPFIQVNCSALPATLVEAELFGVRRGAFTDAKENRAGLFVEASGGTLFLDEIGELPQEAQPKLLHALETGRVRAVGGAAEARIDVRVIAATNVPLEDALRDKRFRPDLYYRLNVIRVEIPPLRERPEDLESLISLLLTKHSAALGRPATTVSAEAMRWLAARSWPGNVRELSNMLERAVALNEGAPIRVEDLDHAAHAPSQVDFLGDAAARGLTLDDVERAYVRRVVDFLGGNVARAAQALGIDRRTVYRRLSEKD